MKITIISHLCIDENISEKSEYRSFGSPGMYMHLLLNYFSDSDVTIVSNYGKDFAEYKEKVKIYPAEPKFEKTMLNRNHSFADGTRKSSSSFRDSNIPVEMNGELRQIILESDVLVIAPLIPNYDKKYLENVFSNAKSQTIKVLLPQGYFRNFDELDNQHFRNFEEADEILEFFDYVILSEEDYPEIDDQSQIWSANFGVKIIMTRGEKGVRIFSDGKYRDVYTNPVDEIVDSVGSGDIFSASFIYKFSQTHDEIESVKFANEIAGKCLSYTAVDILDGKVNL